MISLRLELKLHKAASHWLGWAGALFGTSAAVHLVVLVARGGAWGGAVSFRKPVTFGISFGLLLWTVGWVMDRLPSRRRLEAGLAVVLIGSGIAEVGLITLQPWRGVASHFNFTTPGNEAIFSAMGVAVGFVALALVVLAVWTVIYRPGPPTTRLAVLAGMALLIAGLGLGQWVINLGVEMVERIGRVPDSVLVGEAGVAKFPHALALHGIQVFIGASVIARLARLGVRNQLRVTRLVVWGYGSIVAWAIFHTIAGRSPIDLTGIESAFGIIGVGLFVGATVLLLSGRQSREEVAGSAFRPTVTLPL